MDNKFSVNMFSPLRKLRLFIATLLLLSLWLSGTNANAYAQNWEIYFKGKPLLLPEGPIERNGTIMVPLRTTMEPYGYQIKPLGTGAYQLIGGIGLVDLKIGDKTAILNGTVMKELKVAPEIINGTVFIDLDFAGVLTDIGTEGVPGKPIIELRANTDGVDYDSEYWYAVQPVDTQKVQFVNNTGQVMLQTNYDRAVDFGYGGLSAVYRNGYAVGYIDRTGKLAIHAPHYEIFSFTEGIAPFKDLIKSGYGSIQAKYGYLNRSGKVVIPAIYDKGYAFSDGVAKVVKDGKTYYIDHTGRLVIGIIPNSTHTNPFFEGLASVTVRVKLNGKWVEKMGFINTKGQFVIPPKFDSVGNFSEGLAMASIESKQGYIDQNGKWVIPPQYKNGFALANEFHEGFARIDVKTSPNNYHIDLIDKTGKTLKLPEVKNIGQVSEGLFTFEQNNLVGIMNLEGEVIVKPQFSYVEEFHGGVARAHLYLKSQNRYETLLVNTRGEIVWRSE
jgi:hypothetical protein